MSREIEKKRQKENKTGKRTSQKAIRFGTRGLGSILEKQIVNLYILIIKEGYVVDSFYRLKFFILFLVRNRH